MTGSGRRSARSRVRSSADAGDGGDDDVSLRETKARLKRRRERSKYGSTIPIFDNANLKVVLCISLVAFFVVLFLIHHLVNSAAEPQVPRAVTPFPAPKIMDLPQVNAIFELAPLLNCCSKLFLSYFLFFVGDL